MSVPSVQAATIDVKHCQGHETHVKKCYSREEVREVSAEILNNYQQKKGIIKSSTYMVEGKEKRRFFGNKKVYDLYLKFQHRDDHKKCDNFTVEKMTVITKTVEKNPAEQAVEDVFVDALEN